jgi:NAD(P)-dependent dehydrogenase (short-subunit alcohol dehydrogenase family)
MPLDTLKDKVAVVTGSARGVGWAIVHALAAEGAKVVVADRTEKPRPDLMMPETIYDVAEQIKNKGGTAIPIKVDLRHEDQIVELKNKTLEAYGTVDVVVNNAAITYGAKVWEIPTDRWDQVMAVNPRATFLMAKHFLPILMEKRSGSIINLSSPAGRGPAPGMAVYSASKAAIDYFTLSLAMEVKEYNIAVNCIAPTGGIYSEGNLQLFQDQAWIDTWEPREHFALGVVWLAKQDAQSFTGNLVYSRQLISQLGICKKWCCAALGAAPSVGGPLRIDWESNLPAKVWEAVSATGKR